MIVSVSLLLCLLCLPLLALAEDSESTPSFEQQRREFVRRTFGAERLLFMAVDTSLDQVLGEPCEWGRGAPGFGQRYSDRLGRRIARNGISFIAAAALGEDLRYRPSRETGLLRRFRHVLWQSVGSADGSRPFLISRFTGSLAGDVATTAWRNDGLTTGRIGGRLAWTYMTHLEDSFVAEFGPELKAFGRRTMARVFTRRRRATATVPASTRNIAIEEVRRDK